MDNIAILIPTLDPDIKILRLVDELKKINFENIFIVNDGSDEENLKIFDLLEERGCKIYHHEINKGKGAAIKTGLKNIEKFENIKGVVTVDGDGQHLPKDIKRVAEKLLKEDEIILGTRVFDNKNMPLKNRIGNNFSSFYFKTITGIKLNDTQTGLRGIPSKYIPFCLIVPGLRFDYEMRFLEKAVNKKLPLKTINIDAVYEESYSTHFKAFRDSYSIYKDLFRNTFSSISSAIIDITLFMILSGFISVFNSSVISRLISGCYNFSLNKLWTFEKGNSGDTRNEGKKYIILFTISLFLTSIITQISNNLFVESSLLLLFLKIMVDIILFFINFIVQKKWVFNKNN